MTAREVIARRMDESAERGLLCIACYADAKECQATFLRSDNKQWCCLVCHLTGGRQAHRAEVIG